jgi:pimeloyl-ACP methyl ester carboxylesterase
MRKAICSMKEPESDDSLRFYFRDKENRMTQGLSRRDILKVGAISATTGIVTAGILQATPVSSQPNPVTFVLVHGAWFGGWCWKKLIPLLSAAGHQVYTPTLTGLGERSHLLAPEIDLNTHINDVSAVLEYEDLSNVVLVGHSSGGMVISGVAQESHARLLGLVYLDAFLPEDGKALADYAPVPPPRNDGWRVAPVNAPNQWGVTDETEVAWMAARIGDAPLAPFTQPVQLPVDYRDSLSHTFIQCTQAPFFAEAGRRAQQMGFHYHQMLLAGHMAMITQPGVLAEILLEVLQVSEIN